MGYFTNHWGHFLIDFSTRLYFAQKYKKAKYIYLINKDSIIFPIIPQILRFLQLLDLDINNFIFVNKITKVKTVIIPEQSFQCEAYFSNEYLELFNTVAKNIKPSISNISSKIYFSRSKFNSAKRKEFGGEILDNLFENNGYKIIFPEQISLDDQIFFINNCKFFAGISGTILHNLLFLQNKNTTVICINKSNFINIMLIDTLKLKNINPIFIDAYAMKYPVRLGFGPFLFVNNENLKKFINNFHFNKISFQYDNDNFLRNIIKKYCIQIQNIVFKQRKILYINDNKNSYYYFSPYYINNWIENYSIFESIDISSYKGYTSVDDILKDLSNKYTNCLNNLQNLLNNKLQDVFIYNIHISNFGWLNNTTSGDVCGFYNSTNTIEAFKILSLKRNRITYKFCFDINNWSNNCFNGEICGTTGEHKFIKGISINCENIQILFKVYIKDKGWSQWHKNGDEIFSETGFTAIVLKEK